MAVLLASVAFISLVLYIDPNELCSPQSGCVVHRYGVLSPIVPTAVFLGIVTHRWRRRPYVAIGALGLLYVILLSVGRILQLSPYWSFYAGLCAPLITAWSARTGRRVEIASRFIVGLALLSVIWWASVSLRDVDWLAEEPLVGWSAVIYPFFAMELASIAYERLIHQSRHYASTSL